MFDATSVLIGLYYTVVAQIITVSLPVKSILWNRNSWRKWNRYKMYKFPYRNKWPHTIPIYIYSRRDLFPNIKPFMYICICLCYTTVPHSQYLSSVLWPNHATVFRKSHGDESCSPALFLYSYEAEFIQKYLQKKK